MAISWNLKKRYESAREGNLLIDGLEIQTPSIFPCLKSHLELDWVVETFQFLSSTNQNNILPRIGGFIIEAQKVPVYLDSHLQSFNSPRQTQMALDGKKASEIMISGDFYSILKAAKKALIIDPNLDRLPYSPYTSSFEENIGDFIPKELFRILRKRKSDKDLRATDVSEKKKSRFRAALSKATPPKQEATSRDDSKRYDTIGKEAERAIKSEISGTAVSLVMKMLELQTKYHSNFLISPYWHIDLGHLEEDLELTLRLFRLSNDLTSKLYGGAGAIPVLSIRKNVLLDVSPNPQRNPIPSSWNSICSSFSSLQMPLLLLKVTNFDTDQIEEKYHDGLFGFCRYLRKQTNVPIMILGTNEFFYLLMHEGIDMCSNVMYHANFETGFSSDAKTRKKRDMSLKYYVPRKWSCMKISKVASLDDCQFCQPYSGLKPVKIASAQFSPIRFKHMLYNKNAELEQLIDEMRKGSLRAALLDQCADTSWKKNFTKYLQETND